MKLLFITALLLNSKLATASPIFGERAEFIMACYENCMRGITKQVDGKWNTTNEYVKTFTIRVLKNKDRFTMYASGTEAKHEMNWVGTVNVKTIYETKIDNDGKITNNGYGQLLNTGELKADLGGSNCEFRKDETFGPNSLVVSCVNYGSKELDFSGIVLVTEKNLK